VVDDAVRGAPARSLARAGAKRSVIAYEEWEKLLRVPSFGRLLMAAPLEAGDLPSVIVSLLQSAPLRAIGRLRRTTRLKRCRKS